MQRRLKACIKATAGALALACMFPFATMSAFGRFRGPFTLFAHAAALLPGLVGDYLRVAYYVMTLDECYLSSRISFGSFFAQSSVSIAKNVYIGAYCVIGTCSIGERSQIGSHVQIFGGGHQHARDNRGRILPCETKFTPITVGGDCWIGASAVVMADVGEGTAIGAGAIVPHPIPPHTVAVGNPARVIHQVTV